VVVRATAQQEKPAKSSFGKNDLVTEIVGRLEGDTKLKKKDVEAVVSLMLDVIVDKVAEGTKVSIIGFGSFEPRKRSARTGRNPKTGQPLEIPAKTAPAFSAGKSFKDRVEKH
jgi:DNA-binding protein HU-beta